MIATCPQTQYFQGFAGFLFAPGTRKVHGGYTKNLYRLIGQAVVRHSIQFGDLGIIGQI